MNIITRQQWGARNHNGVHKNGQPLRRKLPASEIWLHHSVTLAPDLVPPFNDDDAAIRRLDDIGEQRFKAGISYTFATTPVGRVYEGHSVDRVGAHTAGHNTIGIAIVLVGNYDTRRPTDAQITAIAELLVWLHRTGKATRHTLTGGHRHASGNATGCPGDAGAAAIKTINARAEQLWNGDTNTKPPATTSPRTLYRGVTGDDVRAVQAHLKRMFPSYAGRLEVDGIYGPATQQAVTDFQRRAKAEGQYRDQVDGVIGVNTWATLKHYGFKP